MCRASSDDRKQPGGIDWDAEFRKAKSSEMSKTLSFCECVTV